ELAAAKRLADLGHKIYLLPRTHKTASPDMLIDDELGDIKECSSLTAVDSQLRLAIYQNCSVAALDLATDLPETKVREIIQHRLERN
ncbi:MAG: hypothetical protein ACTTKL_09155, partial [Treponema sp.]